MITDFNNQVGCNQASISWNWSPENPLTDPDNTEFEEFGAIGISFFSASGDYGSWDAVSAGSTNALTATATSIPKKVRISLLLAERT